MLGFIMFCLIDGNDEAPLGLPVLEKGVMLAVVSQQ
jgi:hypothetical protein